MNVDAPLGALDYIRTTAMNTTEPQEPDDILRSLLHRLNNQLGVILAHAELLEAKSPDAGQKARATLVVTAALQAMGLAREIRTTIGTRD